jgi:hypothetical protein
MGQDLPPSTIVDFIVSDFEGAWDALASVERKVGRGNFLFARQAMILLEVACRLCQSDASGAALREFSLALVARDGRYFAALPGSCCRPGEFRLPTLVEEPGAELIAALFDLIRNGQAHQYQQIRATLTDGREFQVSLSGADFCRTLARVAAAGRPVDHLAAQIEPNRDIWLRVRPEVLFMDIRDAVREASLCDRGLTLEYLRRPGPKGLYAFSGDALERALKDGGLLPKP